MLIREQSGGPDTLAGQGDQRRQPLPAAVGIEPMPAV